MRSARADAADPVLGPQRRPAAVELQRRRARAGRERTRSPAGPDRKSTRLNSSHSQISYAVFCLKKKDVHQEYQEREGQDERSGGFQLVEGLEPESCLVGIYTTRHSVQSYAVHRKERQVEAGQYQ